MGMKLQTSYNDMSRGFETYGLDMGMKLQTSYNELYNDKSREFETYGLDMAMKLQTSYNDSKMRTMMQKTSNLKNALYMSMLSLIENK